LFWVFSRYPRSQELFVWATLELQSSWSLPHEKLGL
jgi:hypothetical protein